MNRALRIAMLAHSTNPRGGVVHAIQLAEALQDFGHEVTLHAPDISGQGFFRATRCETRAFSVAPPKAGMWEMVEQRINDYLHHFEPKSMRDYDLFHAHDGISGNALATLKQDGLIPDFVRTVHHIDDFADVRLTALQARSIGAADQCFVVSRMWQAVLERDWRIRAELSGNGVDLIRFNPHRTGAEAALAARWNLGQGPVFLVIGGVEGRKNTLRILDAFLLLLRHRPDAQLVIAGGASVLDHSAYQQQFADRLSEAGKVAASIRVTGPLADADMPSLYRLAHVMVFASLKEGFGLCVLEAMATGLPVVVSSIPPFTEYLACDDALWCDPFDTASIAEAMLKSFEWKLRESMIQRGILIAQRHGWARVAQNHLPIYAAMKEQIHA